MSGAAEPKVTHQPIAAGVTRRRMLALSTGLVAGLGNRAALAQSGAPVTIALQYGIGYLPIMAADALGLFDKHIAATGDGSSKVVLRRLSGATAINDALLSGSIDVGAYGLPGMLILAEKTRGSYAARGLASLSTGGYSLFTSKPGIKSVRDFTPSDRIAVTAPNTPQGILLQMAAEKAFGDGQGKRLDTLMVSLPHPDATTAMLSGNGSITGYFATEPFSSMLAADPKLHVVTTSEAILGVPATSGMLATTGKFVHARPAVAAAVVAALQEANGVLQSDPVRGYGIYIKSEPSKLPQETLVKMIASSHWDVAPSGVMAYAGFMQKVGMLKSVPARWQDVFYPPVSDGPGS